MNVIDISNAIYIDYSNMLKPNVCVKLNDDDGVVDKQVVATSPCKQLNSLYIWP